jgi:phage host-nuclease inhibitor protein Gam
VIINKQVYYLNQLDTLNTQLSNINNQIIAKINTINHDDTLTTLSDERVRLNTQLNDDKASLTDQMSSTTNNLMGNSNILDLEYIQRDEALETNTYYYIFLLLLLVCIIAIITLISMQL